MELETLKVKTRQTVRKGEVSRLRKAGVLPGVLYGGAGDAVKIQLDARVFMHLLHSHVGEHAAVQLDVEDKPELSTPALIKVVQHHALRGEAIHADFQRIRLDERITTMVSVRVEGRPQGVVDGGVLDQQIREVEVECLAIEIPEELVIDIAALKIGDILHVSDLVAPEHVDIKTDPTRALVTVHPPRVLETAAPAEGEPGAEGGAEPEVIGEKKPKESGD